MATNNSVNSGPIQYNVQVGGANGTLSNVAPSATSGLPVVSAGSSANPTFGTAVVAGGGTGITAAGAAYAPICAGTTTTGAFQTASTGISTSGFVLTSNGASALPTWQANGSSTTVDITGDTGPTLTGNDFVFSGGSTGLSFAGTAAPDTLTLSFAGITANGGTVSLATDATTSTINIGTGAGVKTSTFGSTNSTSATTIACGTGGIAVGTSANAHTSTFGSTSSTSATTVQSGSGALAVTSTGGTLTVNSGTGTLGISTDSSATTVNIGTGSGNKTVSLGSTTSGSTLTLSADVTATYTGRNIVSNTSNTGSFKLIDWQNTDNTSAASHSLIRIQNGGSSGGCPVLNVVQGTSLAYGYGIDPTTTALREVAAASDSVTPSAGNVLRQMTSAGQQTLPLQPNFMVFLDSSLSNVTGDGTTYTVIFDTEAYDQGSNFNLATGTFTAPVTGTYQFSVGIFFTGLGALFTDGRIVGNGSAFTFQPSRGNYGVMQSGGNLVQGGSFTLKMTAADTMQIQVNVSGSTKTIGLLGGGSSSGLCFFSGVLVC